MKISSELCPRENPAGLIEKLLSPEFLGIRLNLVEEVAAVETQAVAEDLEFLLGDVARDANEVFLVEV